MRTSQISDSQQRQLPQLSLGAFLPQQNGYRIALLIIVLALPVVAFYILSAENGKTPLAKAAQMTTSSSANSDQATAQGSISNTQAHASAVTPEATANSDSSSDASNNSSSSTDITVNGQPVAVPPSGNVHTTIIGQNSTTTVDVSSHGSGSGSSTNLSIQSSSTSTD